ncbi:MAG: DUF3990 domain-containing protein [Prevotella sp.]|nr:DUF3990 domain-containing protein [Candidatus Prevotella equi]
MRLFHGSTINIETILLEKSKPYKDFGKAFYLSAERSQAEELAESRVSFLGGEAVINEFEFDETLLVEGVEEPLRVKIFPHYCLEWAEFVWNNRDEEQNYKHDYDIVYGPIANDTVGYQMRQYREESTDLRGFLQGLKYRKGETFQYAFCSERALKYLKKI